MANAKPGEIRGIIFDFDGLILDTEGPAFASWQEIYGEYGLALPLSVWEQVLGGFSSGPLILEHLEAQLGRPIDRAAVFSRREALKSELMQAESVLPGVREWVAEARRLGLGLAVASSSSREWVAGHLERLELMEPFDCLHCRDDVKAVKPEPDLYLAALAALGVAAGEAIAIEDSPNGITAAKRAGLFCVAIPNPLTAQLSLEHADLILPSLKAMRLAELLQIVSRRRSDDGGRVR